MLTRKGFTLIELLIAVIVIGILASIAMPNYLQHIERSKVSKAITNLTSLRKVWVEYFYRFDTYDLSVNGWAVEGAAPSLEDSLGTTRIASDTDWDYSLVPGSPFLLQAQRTGGDFDGGTITLSPEETWAGDYAGPKPSQLFP